MTEEHSRDIPRRVPTTRQPELFQRIGGRKTIERIVDSFYTKVENDKELLVLLKNSWKLELFLNLK